MSTTPRVRRSRKGVPPSVATSGVELVAPKGLGFGAHNAQEESRNSSTLFAHSVGRLAKPEIAAHLLLPGTLLRSEVKAGVEATVPSTDYITLARRACPHS